ncbi:MAG: YihY/virulence factor BrkB family protein [Actinomycetales bacterium]
MPASSASHRVARWLRAGWAIVADTVRLSLRYRVTALAAEAAFFALLALPPLVLALAASAAWLGSMLTSQLAIERMTREYLSPFLTEDVVRKVIIPTMTSALNRPRYDVMSLGFVFSLWSGSRALHVYVDTISIMYGLAGSRGIVASRLMSFGLYVLALFLGSAFLPIVLVGPELLHELLPVELQPIVAFYWPVVAVVGVMSIAWLFHISVPVRVAWWRNLPGAFLALLLWLGASSVMRFTLSLSLSPAQSATGAVSIYGPLTTPIVLLIWLYLLALAVLIGAAMNAAIERRWPDGERSRRRAEVAEQLAREESMGVTLTPVRDTEVEQSVAGMGAAAAFQASKDDVTPARGTPRVGVRGSATARRGRRGSASAGEEPTSGASEVADTERLPTRNRDSRET